MTQLNWTYKAVQDVIKKKQEEHKHHYECNMQCYKLEAGERVLIKQKAYKSKHKIQDHWENTPYCVLLKAKSDIQVYRVKKR